MSTSTENREELQGYDETQIELMEEQCIVLDREDNVIRGGSKYECHLNKNIEEGLLHRAFSVFLFDTQGRLLLQQRAAEKITFPEYWTNSCCSHPLYNDNELATSEDDIALGVKRAAVRKLEHELGITDVNVEDFTFLTRILYKAPCSEKWGEHEIDYILLVQKDVPVAAVANEVMATQYVSADELRELLDTADEKGVLVTPWFKLICEMALFDWWKKLDSLEECYDPTIQNFC